MTQTSVNKTVGGDTTIEQNNYNPPADDPEYEDVDERTPQEAEWENSG